MSISTDIKTAIKKNKMVMGSRSVVKSLKNGKTGSVIYATNLPKVTLRDLNRYSNISKVELKGFDGNSAELGELCGKPFPILMLGIRK